MLLVLLVRARVLVSWPGCAVRTLKCYLSASSVLLLLLLMQLLLAQQVPYCSHQHAAALWLHRLQVKTGRRVLLLLVVVGSSGTGRRLALVGDSSSSSSSEARL